MFLGLSSLLKGKKNFPVHPKAIGSMPFRKKKKIPNGYSSFLTQVDHFLSFLILLYIQGLKVLFCKRKLV